MRKKQRPLEMEAASAVLFLLFLFMMPDASQGHAYPDHADPRVGSTVPVSPSSVRIWFDSDLEPLFCTLVVKDADGNKVDRGDVRVDPSNPALLEVSLPSLPPGAYRVFWNVVARDTHRTTGDYTFTIK